MSQEKYKLDWAGDTDILNGKDRLMCQQRIQRGLQVTEMKTDKSVLKGMRQSKIKDFQTDVNIALSLFDSQWFGLFNLLLFHNNVHYPHKLTL